MFSKTDRTAPGNAIPSIIGTSMKVSGDLDSEGAVQIEGTIHGDIRCAEVTVGRDAHVQGHINAEVANIHGAVNGEIRAARVVLSATARVVGNIIHEELSIEVDAHVEGQMMRRDTEQARLNLVVGETS
jgi:cytoskeletal protein CcmA (bactofilin family)